MPQNDRPQPPLTRASAPTAFALRNIADRKARGRLRAAATAEAIGKGELEWTDAEGWRYQLEAPPVVTIAAKDNERSAATVDLKVWDAAGTLIFRDRVHAWDGFPVLVPDGSEHEEDDGQGGKVRVSNFRESPVEAARLDLAHTVRVVTKSGKSPWVKAKPGTVSTFYAGTEDGRIESGWDVTYSTARAGSSATSDTNIIYGLSVGQRYEGSITSYMCIESFIPFDTSSLSSEEVSDAQLSLYLNGDGSTTDFMVEVTGIADWGTLTYADFVPGASLGTAVATFTTSSLAGAAYYTFSGDLTSLVEKSGTTRFLLASSRHRVGNTPTGNEYVSWKSANEAGTTQDPKLVVTHAAASVPFRRTLLGVGF